MLIIIYLATLIPNGQHIKQTNDGVFDYLKDPYFFIVKNSPKFLIRNNIPAPKWHHAIRFGIAFWGTYLIVAISLFLNGKSKDYSDRMTKPWFNYNILFTCWIILFVWWAIPILWGIMGYAGITLLCAAILVLGGAVILIIIAFGPYGGPNT